MGSLRSWDPTWGGYLTSPEVTGSVICLSSDAPHISVGDVGRMAVMNLERQPETGALRATAVQLIGGQSAGPEESDPAASFEVKVTLPPEVQAMGYVLFPKIDNGELANAFALQVLPGQTVFDVTEAACSAIEDVCNIYTLENEVPGFEPLCLLNRRLHAEDGQLHPLPFNELAANFLRDGDQLILDGEFLDLGAQEPRKPETEKLPVTIITGFLGSGKTTFLKRVHAHGPCSCCVPRPWALPSFELVPQHECPLFLLAGVAGIS